ncbi:uncharacterized protein LOC141936204 isoform X4 [Strix uralensis]|uniref:uncharacterized protein LOC141936204 isoform X4 n=1 Tax=Strix uralensis TaxID=36305 RepID=UPI003DA74B8E
MLGGMWLCLVPWAAQGVDATALRLRVLLFTAGSEASQTPSALDAFAPGASCQPQPRRAAGLNQTPPGSSQGDRNPGPGSAIRRGDAPAAFASSSPLPGPGKAVPVPSTQSGSPALCKSVSAFAGSVRTRMSGSSRG